MTISAQISSLACEAANLIAEMILAASAASSEQKNSEEKKLQ